MNSKKALTTCLLSIQYFGKSHGAKHAMLLVCQAPTVAFLVLAHLCAQTAEETETAYSVPIERKA